MTIQQEEIHNRPMKKIWYTAIIMMMISLFSPVYSAEKGSFELSIGMKGVTGAGFFLGDGWDDELDRYDLKNNPVITFGGIVLLDMNFVQKGVFGFGLQPEFMFCRTGGMSSINSDDYDYYTLWMADISLYVKLRFKMDKCIFFLLAGPSIGLPATDIDVDYNYNDNTINDSIKPDYDYCLGLGAGIGLDIPMGIGKLEIAILYKPYFTSYLKNNEMLQNMAIFSLGYSFTVVK